MRGKGFIRRAVISLKLLKYMTGPRERFADTGKQVTVIGPKRTLTYELGGSPAALYRPFHMWTFTCEQDQVWAAAPCPCGSAHRPALKPVPVSAVKCFFLVAFGIESLLIALRHWTDSSRPAACWISRGGVRRVNLNKTQIHTFFFKARGSNWKCRWIFLLNKLKN